MKSTVIEKKPWHHQPTELLTGPPPSSEPDYPPVDLWDRMRRQLTWQTIHNSQVGAARDKYLRQHDYIETIGRRAAYYLHYIVEQVEARGLPIEVALLPVVESALNPAARSPDNALGLWQIMPGTGRELGLSSSWWYDGRRDIRTSTRAALDYLEELNAVFDGDWMLTLAAYNSGPYRVKRAIARNESLGKATDYWSLDLPRETRNYVPRVIALAAIITYPHAFDIEFPPVPNASPFEVVATDGQIEMVRAAELAGIELTTLRSYNAGHYRWATSPDPPHELLLPLGTAGKFAEGLATLTDEDRVQWAHYRIERGDSLIRIANKFDTEVQLLREVNNIRGSRIRAGDTMLIPRGSDWSASLAMADTGERKETGYKVRPGDSLYVIAGKFNISIDDIINWNALDPGKYLQPGQRLTLFLSGG